MARNIILENTKLIELLILVANGAGEALLGYFYGK